MATIRKRGDKWQAQVRRRGRTLSRTFFQRADAKRWAHETEIDADRRGLVVTHQSLSQITVSDIVVRYRNTVVPAHRGHKNEAIIINAFLRHSIARNKLSNVSAATFADYRDERLKSVRPATINRELGLIQHAFEIARREWSLPLPVNPVREIKKPKVDRPRERRLRDGEQDKLLEGCRQCRNRMILPLVQFAIETAMRRGELTNARWRELDWAARTLQIPVTKNGESRTIPLSQAAVNILARLHRDGRNENRIFSLTDRSVSLAWKRLVRRVGITDLHFHDLRHEAISRFFEMELSVPQVALISGHKDPRMLFRYTHLRAKDVADRLNSTKPPDSLAFRHADEDGAQKYSA